MDRIFVRRTRVSCAAVFGVHTNSFWRDGISLMPVTLYGPSMMPLRSRGMPDGLCASWLARSSGCQTFCSCAGPLDEREADVVQARGDLDARRRHALVEHFARDGVFSFAGLVILLAANRRGEDLLAVDGDDELCGVSCPSTPTSPSATVFSSRPENTYSPSAGK